MLSKHSSKISSGVSSLPKSLSAPNQTSVQVIFALMFRFLQFKLNINAANARASPQLFSLQIISLKSLSTTTNSSQRSIDYLINSLDFSQESALKIASHIDLKTLTKPNSVLALFKNYGFTQTHITSIITKLPKLLVANPNKILKPKLDFLSHNLISGHNLAHIISNDPNILKSSLEKKIIPCIGFLKSFFNTNDETVSLLLARRGTWVLHKFSPTMEPNTSTLRRFGVPYSNISWMITMRPWKLSRGEDEFSEIVRKIKEMGFDPESMMFIRAICAMLGMKKDKWVSKFEVFKSFGWSEEQLRSLFAKHPNFMNSSEEHIKKALDFFMNKLKWTTDDLAKYPVVLHLSLEKRIMPRLFVVQFLISEGLVKRSCSIGKVFIFSEVEFLKRFLVKYEKKIPHLLQMYQNKMGV